MKSHNNGTATSEYFERVCSTTVCTTELTEKKPKFLLWQALAKMAVVPFVFHYGFSRLSQFLKKQSKFKFSNLFANKTPFDFRLFYFFLLLIFFSVS